MVAFRAIYVGPNPKRGSVGADELLPDIGDVIFGLDEDCHPTYHNLV